MSNKPDWWELAEAEIDEVLVDFTEELKEKLEEFGNKPMSLLGRKNPFLFRIRGAKKADNFVRSMLEASLSSSEETKFGKIFEKWAEIIAKYGKNGQKSGIEGIDVEYSEGTTKRVLIQVKSGKNWGNSSQKKQLKSNFQTATRVLRQGDSVKDVRCIEGISYGKRESRHLGSHERIVGVDFWEEISGWDELYFFLIDVVEKHASNGLQDAKNETVDKVVRFMREKDLLEEEDEVNWDNLIVFLSGPSSG